MKKKLHEKDEGFLPTKHKKLIKVKLNSSTIQGKLYTKVKST